MRKIKLIIAAVSMLSLVSTSGVYADGFAPGEGLYLGAFAAVGMGMVQPKVTTVNTAAVGGNRKGGIFEATDGGLGLEGAEGGVHIGYGYKMGDLYVGFEGESAWGDIEFKLTSNTPITGVGLNKVDGVGTAGITSITATKDWTSGAFGRLGYYVNKDTLISFKGGILASKFDVAFGGTKESYYAGGPSFGVSLSSSLVAVDPNLSVRMGAVYTDFLTAPVTGIGTLVSSGSNNDAEITGSALSARLGVQYSFFDVNSLF